MMRDLARNLKDCSINTATLGFDVSLRDKIDQVARAGFGHISPWRLEVEGQDVKAIARIIRDAKLSVPGYYRSTFLPQTTSRSLSDRCQVAQKILTKRESMCLMPCPIC
jgi:hypothetical protein